MGGAAFSDAKAAAGIVPIFLMPFMLFAGFYANSKTLESWISWF